MHEVESTLVHAAGRLLGEVKPLPGAGAGRIHPVTGCPPRGVGEGLRKEMDLVAVRQQLARETVGPALGAAAKRAIMAKDKRHFHRRASRRA